MQKNHLLLTLFGATGDLAARKLYPAIYRLYLSGHLSEHFALIGTARREWTHEHFRSVVLNSIQSLIEDTAHAEAFVSHFYYQPHDVQDQQHYIQLQQLADSLDKKYDLQGNRIFYLSTAPHFFPIIAKHLKSEQLLSDTGYNRLIIEKPFGHDYPSAKLLQEQLGQVFDESQIYRIDHYLGKEVVQAVSNLRFDNTLFKKQWNASTIDNVQITLAETIGVEERGEYYETSGATRDMIQNHALQLLALVAMQQPEVLTSQSIQQAKINVLNSIKLPTDLVETQTQVVRAQYESNGNARAYRDEPKVSADSVTETYFAAEIHLDLPEWQGVPFYLRSGKCLTNKATFIDIEFKPANNGVQGERLRLEIAPNLGYELWLNTKQVGTDKCSKLIPLRYHYSEEELTRIPDDYERLIGECIDGDKSHFAHWQEVAAAWRYIDTIHAHWQKEQATTLPTYPAGSNGPVEAEALLARTSRQWRELG
ncbi:glucose-6-phosphate dehydrogenase [Aerococcaceae bacterium NML201209]|nr:glucose-6-phosphate dehydrogenase [Aerococcaceae bacterium NML201209]MCW6666695.1 glucose-6-phosphate dehydrogenase [Aerococcaceae bacterium NML190938]